MSVLRGTGAYCNELSPSAKRQVNQITASTNSTKPESISLGVSDSPNSLNLSNKFDVLSQLEEELND